MISNKNIDFMLMLLMFLIGLIGCSTSRRIEIVNSKSWITGIPETVKFPKDVIEQEYTYIPDEYQEKYIGILKNQQFKIINNKEYEKMFGQLPPNQFAIVFRAVSFSSEPISQAYDYLYVYRIKDTANIAVWERRAFEPDWDEFRLHRIALIYTTDVLPSEIYVGEPYGIFYFPDGLLK
jgi:hypothetical protein